MGVLAAAFLTAGFKARAENGRFEIIREMFPLTITNSGSYLLTEDIDFSNSPFAYDGITISASDVHLDLNGHYLMGSIGNTDDGIAIDPVRNVTVENGFIHGWGGDGIDAGYDTATATGCVFRKIQTSYNYRDGLRAGRSAYVENCFALRNGLELEDLGHETGTGILIGQSSLARRCVSVENWGHGIASRSSGEISDCIVYRNQHDGYHTGQGMLIRGSVAYGQRLNGDGLEVDGGSVVVDCVAVSNNDDGMKTRTYGRSVFVNCSSISNSSDGINARVNGVLVAECTATRNKDDGLAIDSRSLIVNNLCVGNGFISGDGGGINIKENAGDRCRIDSNHLAGNREGLRIVGAGASQNIVMRNSAVGNSVNDYNYSVNNDVAPIRSSVSTADPWDNFSF
ncbi:MAG: right-handed parallel beta-helix repeat-containing protein [Verrucomicrobia bacterium]|nr:right-handed parallel beta-helix repeat-containing protein [Verrucomicrobiota bacterium]